MFAYFTSSCEPVWPSGKAFVLVSRRTSVQYRFGLSFLFKKVVVCGHCFVTLSLTINETLTILIAAHLNAEIILVVSPLI